MLGFFKRLSYRGECSGCIVQLARINHNEASKFVEWYKGLIHRCYKKGVAPANAVAMTCMTLLKHPESIDKPEHMVVIGAYAMAVIEKDPGSEIANTLSNLLGVIQNSPLAQEMGSFVCGPSVRKEVDATYQQICLFMAASLALVDTGSLSKGSVKIATCLYFCGAADFLAQHNGLNDDEYFDIVFRVVRRFGLSEESAREFLDLLPRMAQEPFGFNAMSEGLRTFHEWVTDKDVNAPVKLVDLVSEWKEIED